MSNEVRIRVTAKDEASKEVEGIGGRIKGFADGFGDAMKAAGAVGVAAVVGLGISSMKMASDYNESLSKVRTVFKGAAGDIESFSKTSANALGVSSAKALDFAGSFGNMFDQLKIGSQQSADMSKNIIQLAADFGSFHNADITEVLQAQSAAFRGEYDALQRFLPLINAAAVEQKAMEMTGKENAKSLNQQEKALATYQLMLDGAGAAQGDFARTSDGAANSQKRLTASFEDLRVTIGQKLLPVAERVMGRMVNIMQDPATQRAIDDWSEALGRFVINTSKGFETVVIPAFSWIINNKAALVTAIIAIGAAFAWTNPVLAALAAIGFALNEIGKRNAGGGWKNDLIAEAQRRAGLQSNNTYEKAIAQGGVYGPSQPMWTLDNVRANIDAYSEAATKADASTFKLTEEMGGLDGAGGAKEKVLTLAEALEDLVIDFAEAIELKLTPAQAGMAEAAAFVADVQRQADEEAYNYAKTQTKLNALLAEGKEYSDKYQLSLRKENLEKLKAAASSITGQPTQEQAQLQLQLAQLDRNAAGFGINNIGLSAQNDARRKQLEGEIANLGLQKERMEAMKQDTTVIDNLVKMRQAEIESLSTAMDRLMEPMNREREGLEAKLRLMTAEHALQEAQLTAADKTLLTERERATAMSELTRLTRDQSSAARELAKDFRDLVPDMRAALIASGFPVSGSGGGGLSQDFGLAARGVAQPPRFTPPAFVNSGGLGR